MSAPAQGWRFAGTLAVAAAAVVFALRPGVAAPPVKRLAFDVFRGADRIGSHVTTIAADGARSIVETHTSVEVKILFFDAYHYQFTAREVMEGGAFASFVSTTDDNGTHHQVAAVKRQDGKLEVTADGKAGAAAANAVPGSFWNESLMRSGPIIMVETGQQVKVTVAKVGEEADAAGRKLEHYKVTGGMERDIWFHDHYPVRYRLVARDGSVIESRAR